VVWGVAFGGVPALLQTRLLRTASFQMRDLAAALQTTAFNIGIGGGALLGGILLDGVGIRSLPLVELGLLALGLAVSVAVDVAYSRRAQRLA
jgi:DHA1 family inner membrane transport protein